MKKTKYILGLGFAFSAVCQADVSINPTMVGGNGLNPSSFLNFSRQPFNSSTMAGPLSGTSYSGVDIAKMSLLHAISSPSVNVYGSSKTSSPTASVSMPNEMHSVLASPSTHS